MTYTGTITSKGQMTIPKSIREFVGLKTSERVAFVFDPDQQAIIFKKPVPLRDLHKLLGSPKKGNNHLKGYRREIAKQLAEDNERIIAGC
jgi:AbrB family looped-hinge helix DNA binding protein